MQKMPPEMRKRKLLSLEFVRHAIEKDLRWKMS